jgi:hypothetical protein
MEFPENIPTYFSPRADSYCIIKPFRMIMPASVRISPGNPEEKGASGWM